MTNANSSLIYLLGDESQTARTRALNWLSEGYARQTTIVEHIFQAWDEMGIREAFPEFPGLSHLPIASEQIVECCQRAGRMLVGHKLTATETRCAGKLLEHVSQLPAAELQPHLDLIKEIVAKSKIFFRVDVHAIENRIRLLGMAADELASELDKSLRSLIEDSNDLAANHRALHALEALRRQHPNYVDLSSVFATTPPSGGPSWLSFQVTLQSLLQLEEPGLESQLGQHLLDDRDSVFVPIVEALVRIASPAAADALTEHFPVAPGHNRQWIARGLQRIRVQGRADSIAALRGAEQDYRLWLMLLVAEIRQFDPVSRNRVIADVARVGGSVPAVSDSMEIFSKLVSDV
ncbi:MAG: hypothetical protein R3C53_14320 [Pirellulaceae bacterium]